VGKKNDQDRLTAYHEAAHVVARYRFQIGEVTYSTIKSGTHGQEASVGYTEAAWKPEGDAKLTKEETIAAYKEMEQTLEFIVLTLAGPAAEYVYLRWPDSQYSDFLAQYMETQPKSGPPPDPAQAYRLLKTDDEEEMMEKFDEAWRYAIGFVKTEWESINKVARLLLEKKTVQGGELYAQIRVIDERKEV
jgi:DNA-directed RNA polymerase subunit F